VKFTFGRYGVPRHLEAAWLEDVDYRAEPRIDLRRWYIVAAQGGSLFDDGARAYLSRAEIHHFLNPASSSLTAPQALWYAVARVHTGDPATATRIARSRLSAFSISCPFWKEAARYFARHPVSVPELNDLVDYLHAARDVDPGFRIWGRSLPALRERMLEWHRTRQAGQGFCHLSWQGSSIPNALYEVDGVTWRFMQIRRGMRLFEEGQKMRHCVAAYRQACVSGESTIWSLTRQDDRGVRRCLTIELHPRGLIVQCRGFANRSPTDEEVAIITRWAGDFGLLSLDF
jgi:PcfJ-like protein